MKKDKNGGVLNTDLATLNKYKQDKQLHNKIRNLSDEINSIKQCLARVCERLDQIEKR